MAVGTRSRGTTGGCSEVAEGKTPPRQPGEQKYRPQHAEAPKRGQKAAPDGALVLEEALKGAGAAASTGGAKGAATLAACLAALAMVSEKKCSASAARRVRALATACSRLQAGAAA
jgi:hypothetical protein